MKPRSNAKRVFINRLVMAISAAVSGLFLFILGWVLYEVVMRGGAALNFSFFTKLPTPPGIPGGGLANAIIGTLMMAVLAIAIGVPIGLLAGVYLSEFGQESRFANAVRFVCNVLMGTPSIIIGMFVYALLVVPTHRFSGYAGAVALAILMLPVVTKTTEDILKLVPNTLRESALALAAPRWKVTLGVVFRAGKSGLLTGILLAIARISGETAPLLFTALNSPYWPRKFHEPVANLTVTIFNYAMSPYTDWQQKAWGASLLITTSVLLLTLIARFALVENRK
ncbi:MAG: phosphate ABC transporter, permease protein PstA [Planctomycetes bacterium RBG_13_46_10]|nr:MAG: phosphate ABC transporter, permease protein PstA [Planctomycetes bacterium RBG_13_46_10]